MRTVLIDSESYILRVIPETDLDRTVLRTLMMLAAGGPGGETSVYVVHTGDPSDAVSTPGQVDASWHLGGEADFQDDGRLPVSLTMAWPAPDQIMPAYESRPGMISVLQYGSGRVHFEAVLPPHRRHTVQETVTLPGGRASVLYPPRPEDLDFPAGLP